MYLAFYYQSAKTHKSKDISTNFTNMHECFTLMGCKQPISVNSCNSRIIIGLIKVEIKYIRKKVKV